MNVGAARVTERYGLSEKVTEEACLGARGVAAELAVLDGRPVPDSVVGMGGAVTNLAAVGLGLATYDPDAVHGSVLDRAEIDRQIELYRTRSAEQRRQIVGLQPGRAEVILAGACIVRHDPRQARAGVVHRERPWPAPRFAHGAIWRRSTSFRTSETTMMTSAAADADQPLVAGQLDGVEDALEEAQLGGEDDRRDGHQRREHEACGR